MFKFILGGFWDVRLKETQFLDRIFDFSLVFLRIDNIDGDFELHVFQF